MLTVRDYHAESETWIVWEASTLVAAYGEYPFLSPSVTDLAGKLHIATSQQAAAAGVGANTGVPPRSVWRVDALEINDVIGGFHLEGHTGRWGIEVYEPAPGESSVRGLVLEGEDLSPETGDQALFTLDLIDIFPLNDGLPDTLWLQENNDIVLNYPA